jgi:type I restriction enzyme, S subunit
VSNGWQTKRLEEVCHFSNGLWKGEKPPFVQVGVIRNTNFTKEGTLDDSDIAYLDVEAKKLEKRRLQFGDIILEKSGGGPKQPVGRVALFDKRDGQFSFSNFTAAMRIVNPRELDFRYLHKFLHWTYLSGVTEAMQSHSTGIRNLDADAYRAIPVSYPTISEQRRIVGILDEAFDGIATAKAYAGKNLRNARAMFESCLHTVFSFLGSGWTTQRLGDLVELIDCLHKTPSYVEIGFPMVRVTDVKPGNLDVSKSRKVNEETFKEFARKHTPKTGDIVFSRVGTYGVSSFVASDEPFCLGQNTVFIVPKNINPRLLYQFLNSSGAREQIDAMVDGTTQPTISLKSIREIRVAIPPVADQPKIVAKIDCLTKHVEKLTNIYQRKLAALEALKKSLLYQAFSARL